MEINKILFPTDFSDYAQYAQDHVIDLAKKYGAKVILLHVVPLTVSPYPMVYPISEDELAPQLREAAQKRLEQLEATLKGHGVAVETATESGPAFAGIVSAARELQADMIIMGTHGHGAVRQMLLGSTAEKVVRKAECPVLTVRHPDHKFELP